MRIIAQDATAFLQRVLEGHEGQPHENLAYVLKSEIKHLKEGIESSNEQPTITLLLMLLTVKLSVELEKTHERLTILEAKHGDKRASSR